jgi:hypothetical protein
MDSLAINWADIKLASLLSKGGQGQVFKATWRVSLHGLSAA